MPTVIDSLIVELGLDPKQFTDAQKGVIDALHKIKGESERQAKGIEEQGKKAALFFDQMKKGAIEFLAVFTAGLGTTEFVRFLTAADTGLGRLSERLGISARDLGAWGGAATLLGGTTAGVSQSIQSLITRFANISITGDTSLIPFLRALNVNLKTSADGTLDWQDALIKMSDALSRMPRARATTFLQDMGITDPGTVNLLLRGGDAVRRMVASLKQFSPTASDIRASEARTKSFALLEASAIEVGRTLLTQLTPAIDAVANLLTKLAAWASSHPTILDTVFFGATSLVVALGAALAALSFTALIAALASLATPIGLVVLAIGALAGAAVFVAEKWEWFKSEAKLIWSEISNIIQEALQPALAVIHSLEWAYDKITGHKSSSKTPVSISRKLTRGSSPSIAQQEAYIRSAAKKRGVDPNVAVAVARSEGLGRSYAGDRGSSFGPYQLHMGGLTGGEDAVGGLGDTFMRQTGLDPRNPATWKAQVNFALDQAAMHGWGAWHGAQRIGLPDYAGIGAGARPLGTASNVTTIGSVTVQTQATDATGIARDIRGALARQLAASDANGGFN